MLYPDGATGTGPSGSRHVRILTQLSAGGIGEPAARHLCSVCASVTVMDGAGIMLMSGDVADASIGTADALGVQLDDLQYTLGEGPGIDAHRMAGPVLEPDLARSSRWIAFSAAAVAAGAAAAFAFPLQVGAVRLGAMTLHRCRPGGLDDDQYADAVVMADVAAQAVLAMQACAPLGVLAVELASGTGLRVVVHQAAGMLSVQLGISVGDALVRLRARAYRSDVNLVDLATAVVDHRLRFDDRTAGP